jgi:hypothetical protein
MAEATPTLKSVTGKSFSTLTDLIVVEGRTQHALRVCPTDLKSEVFEVGGVYLKNV